MLQCNLNFREIRRTDYKAIEKIICDTWDYEKFCTPKTARALSKLYLTACLANQTYTCVSLNGEEPIGIIMGKLEKAHHTMLRYSFLQFPALLAMLATKRSRQVLKTFKGFTKIYDVMFAESAKTFDGEVAFFAIRWDQRGAGIGAMLWDRLSTYMKSQNVQDFYVYTDDTCNYGFYEHYGMERIGEKKCNLEAYDNRDMTFFMYDYHMK